MDLYVSDEYYCATVVLPRTSAHTHSWGRSRKGQNGPSITYDFGPGVQYFKLSKAKIISPPNTPRCQLRENMESAKPKPHIHHLSEEKLCEHTVEQQHPSCHCQWITNCFARSRILCSGTMRVFSLTRVLREHPLVTFLGLTVVLILMSLELGISLEDMIR